MKAIMNISPYLWLLASAALFACGEFVSKKWASAPSIPSAAIVLACYACSSLLWLPALFHRNELAVMGTAWLLLGTIATLGIGYFVFGEILSTRQLAGVALSLVSFILLTA